MEINVWVSVRKGQIQVNPEPIRVPWGQRNVEIIWTIYDSPGWTFASPARGIDILNHGETFYGRASSPRPLKWISWIDRNDHPQTTLAKPRGPRRLKAFKYEVNLVRHTLKGQAPKRFRLDPAIENEGSS